MNVLNELQRLQEKALKDEKLKKELIATKTDPHPLAAFCRYAREKGYEIYEMDLLEAGEELYSSMKRGTNGGGENSPDIESGDDYYNLFFVAIEDR